MKSIIKPVANAPALSLLLMALSSLPAIAEEQSGGNNIAERIEAGTPSLRLASLVKPGEVVEPGDLIHVSRAFGTWSLECDQRPSLNKRLCAAQQIVRSGNDALVWRIAMSEEDRPVVVFALPPTLDVKTGLGLEFSGAYAGRLGFAGRLGSESWGCDATSCIASFEYAGMEQASISNSPQMIFTYTLVNDGVSRSVRSTAIMSGLAETLDAAAKDPFGKSVPVKPQKTAVTAITDKPEAETSPPARNDTQRLSAAKPAKSQGIARAASPREGLY